MDETNSSERDDCSFERNPAKDGCLIDLDDLFIGSILFHISRGKCIVTDVKDVRNTYLLIVRFLEGNSGVESFTKDGKANVIDKYPLIYSKDPFVYTAKIVAKLYRKKNSLQLKIEELKNNKINN